MSTIIQAKTMAVYDELIRNGCALTKASRLSRLFVDWHWPMTRGFGHGAHGRPVLAMGFAIDGSTDKATKLQWFAYRLPGSPVVMYAVWNQHRVVQALDKAEALHKAEIDAAFYCKGCRSETHVGEIGEYAFILHDALWTQATGGHREDRKRYCVECLEQRLGRKLNQDDFDWEIPLNLMQGNRRSDRLMLRMATLP